VAAGQHPVAACSRSRQLRILFIGQAVERKGLPVLLSAFEALRDEVPATLTLVGAQPDDVAPLVLEAHGVRPLGRVGEHRKATELERADVLCAPSLHGESFGMVLTEAFAAGVPVVASDIPGYRDVVGHGREGMLVPPGDPVALAEALRALARDHEQRMAMAAAACQRAQRFGWPHVAGEVLDCYERAIAVGKAPTRGGRLAVRYGLASADLHPRQPRVREPSPQATAPPRPPLAQRRRLPLRALRRAALGLSSLAALGLGAAGLADIGVGRVEASLAASKPGLLTAGLGLMCVAMLVRGLAWHVILRAAPTWRRAGLADALQGTFIGVLMSATLPVRLGEPSRALIVARRLGRARETLPIVMGTLVSQMLLNLLAVVVLAAVTLTSVRGLQGDRPLAMLAIMPVAALLALMLAPVIVPGARASRSFGPHDLWLAVSAALGRMRHGLQVFCKPRLAGLAVTTQLVAWGLQLLSCWLLLAAVGLAGRIDLAGAAAVLFAVNLTALLPLTPANVGLFQAAVVAVLVGVYDVSAATALAYGIVLQATEIATAFIMGLPALAKEGISWKELRVRTLHATPVKLDPSPAPMRAGGGAGDIGSALRG
jgi:phosphatidylinositol alpha-mannosyltransferase